MKKEILKVLNFLKKTVSERGDRVGGGWACVQSKPAFSSSAVCSQNLPHKISRISIGKSSVASHKIQRIHRGHAQPAETGNKRMRNNPGRKCLSFVFGVNIILRDCYRKSITSSAPDRSRLHCL
jgi:hypothetical protein